MKVQIRSVYGSHKRESLSFDQADYESTGRSAVSMTQQQFKDDCDLKSIIERYQLTGLVDCEVHEMHYGDFANVKDFNEAQEMLARVGELFDGLPARTRAYFKNSPSEFLAFVNNNDNARLAKDLGLSSFFSVSKLDSKEGSVSGKGVQQSGSDAGSSDGSSGEAPDSDS